MINKDRWINSLPKVNSKFIKGANELDPHIWVNTIPVPNPVPKKNTYNSVKKYSLMTILFVCGLLFVSVLKNETRNLQKEINKLEAAINVIKFNLNQAILDNEVITSPENISRLAKEYLNINLTSYKRSQIKNLNDKTEEFTKVNKIKKKETSKEKIKNLSTSIKSQVAKKIEKKKTEIKKLQELYNDPRTIPDEIKTQVSKQIKEKEIGLRNIYNSPKEVFTLERVGKWSVVQVVKVFLGMPIVPWR